ncbi:MAG: flagellar biosynthesis protein FlhB [Spirochaetes bacterium]|nr:MAG: flagellar biosynthesis protein FlhB [Spirochaetota bacterium]
MYIDDFYKLPISTPFEIHLQWFAAEDEGRTEEPTEHKLRKAREEGKVVKSSEFTSALILLSSIVVLAILSSGILKTMLNMLKFFLVNSSEIDVTKSAIVSKAFISFFVKISAPIFIVAFVAALLGNIFQVGFMFTVKPITPDIKKIIPKFGKFFKRAMFSSEAAFNLGKSIFKVLIIGFVAYLNIRAEIPKITKSVEAPFFMSFNLIAGIAFRIIVESALALLVLAIPDYMFQKRLHMESLKMSKQEIKEERRMYEGDPLVKSRLRERMRDMLSQNMLRNVPKADVVITNPTHFAIALQWERARMIAPTVTAKGADNIAFKIKEIAGESKVPIVENKPLARALYSEVEIGDEIPEKFYEAMATILAHIYKLSGKEQEAV